LILLRLLFFNDTDLADAFHFVFRDPPAEACHDILFFIAINAYEAVVQVTDSALRKISLSISREKHFLMIKIKNGCQHEPPKENGVYVSTKPDK
jgi:hypothetical protein